MMVATANKNLSHTGTPQKINPKHMRAPKIIMEHSKLTSPSGATSDASLRIACEFCQKDNLDHIQKEQGPHVQNTRLGLMINNILYDNHINYGYLYNDTSDDYGTLTTTTCHTICTTRTSPWDSAEVPRTARQEIRRLFLQSLAGTEQKKTYLRYGISKRFANI